MPVNVYTKLDTDVEPMPNDILVHNIEKGEKKTKSGIIISDDNGKLHGIHPRWCQVYKVGENITEVKPGEWLMMSHGKWTYGIPLNVNGHEIYLQKIDPTEILLVSDTLPEELKDQEFNH